MYLQILTVIAVAFIAYVSLPPCPAMVDWVFKYQTLLAALVALSAALITALLLYRGQKQSDQHHHGRLDFDREAEKLRQEEIDKATLLALSPQLGHIRTLARQHVGTVRVLDANNAAVSDDTKRRLRLPSVLSVTDWQALMKADRVTINHAKELTKCISFHNFRAETTASFAADGLAQETFQRLDAIQNHAQQIETYINRLRLHLDDPEGQ